MSTDQEVITQETDAEPETPEAVADTQPPAPDPDWKAEADKWKHLARKHEAEAKKFRQQSMTEQEKAVAQAREEGMAQARAEAAKQLAAARALAALTGLTDDPQRIVNRLNVDTLLDDDGNVSDEAVAALRDEYAAILPKPDKAPDLGQGVRKNAEPDQLTRADLQNMSPEAINQARADGRLNAILGYT